MVTLRLIGVVFLVIAAIAVGAEAVDLLRTGRWNPISAFQLWLNIDASSLSATRGFIERYVFAALWNPIIMWILLRPAWLVTIVPGAACLVLSINWRAEMPRKRAHRPHKRERARLQGSV